MTNVPSPLTPVYASPATPPPSTRKPVSVIVLSIIGILVGTLFGVICSPLQLLAMNINMGVPNPAVDAIKSDPVLMASTWFNSLQGTLFGIMLVTCSIGALVMKRWARAGMALYGIIQTTLTIALAVTNYVWIQPRMVAAMNQAGAPMPGWQQAIGLGLIGVFLVYQICVWYVFTRPHIIDLYDAAEAAAV